MFIIKEGNSEKTISNLFKNIYFVKFKNYVSKGDDKGIYPNKISKDNSSNRNINSSNFNNSYYYYRIKVN